MGLNEKYTEYLEFAEILDKKLSRKRKLASLVFPINFLLMVVLTILCAILNVNVLISIIVVAVILSVLAAFFYYVTCQKIHTYKLSLFTALSELAIEILVDNSVPDDTVTTISKIAVLSNKYYNDLNFFGGEQ